MAWARSTDTRRCSSRAGLMAGVLVLVGCGLVLAFGVGFRREWRCARCERLASQGGEQDRRAKQGGGWADEVGDLQEGGVDGAVAGGHAAEAVEVAVHEPGAQARSRARGGWVA